MATSVPSHSTPCDHSAAFVQALDKWSNYSRVWHNNSVYFRSYVCMNVRYEATKEACESAEAQLVFILGVFGFLGSFLSTLTFFRRQFVPTDVYLYRLVGGLETVHMLVMTLMHALALYADCSTFYPCMIFSAHLYMTLTNGCAETVEFVVVFLCIERTIACLTPQYFHKIHRLPAYRGVAILALLSSIPLNIVHSFDVHIVTNDDTDQRKYQESPTSFSESTFYAWILSGQLVRFCVVAPLIIVSTAGSIIGLWQAARRKRRLQGDMHKNQRLTALKNGEKRSKSSARSRKEIKQMIDLCCLQLCLAIPVVINYILCLVERACKSGVIERSKLWQDTFESTTYDEARAMINRVSMLEYLRFSISVTHMLAHGLHFYLYLLFSAKFRHVFARFVRIRKLDFCGCCPRPSRDQCYSEALTNGYDRVPASTNDHTVNEAEK